MAQYNRIQWQKSDQITIAGVDKLHLKIVNYYRVSNNSDFFNIFEYKSKVLFPLKMLFQWKFNKLNSC